MLIKFDTSYAEPEEVQGLIALLQTLLPIYGQNKASAPRHLAVPQQSTPDTQPAAPDAQPQPDSPTSSASTGPTLVDAPTDQPRRTRRTKAQIEADEAAKSQSASTPAPVATGFQPDLTNAPVGVIESASTLIKPIDKETLTVLVNGFIARHSMEEALAILDDFECQRISEALALDPAKLNALAEKFRG